MAFNPSRRPAPDGPAPTTGADTLEALPASRVVTSAQAPVAALNERGSGARLLAGARRTYAAAGLLVWMSVVALAGGLLLQATRHQLPFAYTWLQPLNTLQHVAESRNFPCAALLAYAAGVLSSRGIRKIGAGLRGAITGGRQALLLRCFVGLLACALDVWLVPMHSPADALAVGLAAGFATRPWPLPLLRSQILEMGIVGLVFAAICYWFTIVKALTFVGGAQFDAEIIGFEQALLGFAPHRVVAHWAARHPAWVGWFDWAYFCIFEHMALTTALLLGGDKVRARREYVAALAIAYFVGAPLYLTFPAAGPAYFDPSAYAFLRSQLLLVNPVQAQLFVNTAGVHDGRATLLQTWGYIACMPSLHIAHEFVMLYFARSSKPAFLVALAFTALTTVAVVALGWHYPSDLVAGAVLGALAIVLARWQSDRLLPSWFGKQAE